MLHDTISAILNQPTVDLFKVIHDLSQGQVHTEQTILVFVIRQPVNTVSAVPDEFHCTVNS